MLNGDIIRDYALKGQIISKNFDEKLIKGASYDARVGAQAVVTDSKKVIDLSEAGSFILNPGGICTVISFEEFDIPLDIAGHIGLRSYYTRKGIIPFSGPQLDPGFSGVIIIGLFNPSPSDIIIIYKKPLLTLEFFKLVEPASIGYQGKYQNQTEIPLDQIQYLIDSKGESFGNIALKLSALAINVNELTIDVTSLTSGMKSLSKSVNDIKSLFAMGMIFLGLFIAVIGILSIFL